MIALLKQFAGYIILIILIALGGYWGFNKYLNSLSIFSAREKELKEKIKSIKSEGIRLEKINKKYSIQIYNLKTKLKEIDKRDKAIKRGSNMDDAVAEFFK